MNLILCKILEAAVAAASDDPAVKAQIEAIRDQHCKPTEPPVANSGGGGNGGADPDK